MAFVNDLPRGTVTFLFTDIEGSTRRWQDDDTMAVALARHDDIIRTAVETQAGRILKHTGDGAVAVFQAATAAVAATIDAQRRLAEEPWPGHPLRVRMAVHTGEVDERDGDYFGPALNLAARLMAAARGGQVLVSGATQELVAIRMPADAELVDLGEHRLRDVDESQRIFQVAGGDLQREFPPLATEETTTVVLPEPRTSFIGRETERAELRRLLDERRLVTLIGVGGAGKTRLAIEVARSAVGAFRGGVFFADLSAVSDPAGVGRQVADTLGMPAPSGPVGSMATTPTRDALAAFLRDRRALLVLDNCEHLLDDCADLADALLDAASGLVVLATSREALGVDGEQAWQVRSLRLPDDERADGSRGKVADEADAVRLLVDRMRAVQPEFLLAAENRPAVGEICRRLDGIPLALELAAARIAHLSPAEIAARLDDRFRLLVGGRRRSQRQQTLWAAIDWSHDLLDEEEQALLRRLAVFAGGFSLEAVEGICMEGLTRSALDLVGSLVAKSLVERLGDQHGNRYRLLETIRLYGEERLVEAGDADATRSAHRDWFLDRLEAMPWDVCLLGFGAAQELIPDADNLRAAVDWCEADQRPDLLRRLVIRLPLTMHAREGTKLSERFALAVEYESTLPPAERKAWLVRLLVGQAIEWTGEVPDEEAALGELRELIPKLSDDPQVAAFAHLVAAARLTIFPQHADEFLEHADAGAALADRSGPLHWWLTDFKAVALMYQRRFDEALEVVTEIEHAPEDTRVALSGHGPQWRTLLLVLGRPREAAEPVDASRFAAGVADRVPNRACQAVALAATGDVAAARRLIRAAVAEVRTSGWHHPLAAYDCLVAFVAMAALEGDAARAAKLAAATPVTSVPAMWVLVRHYRDLSRAQLDPDTRRRSIEEGRALDVNTAIDAELARWDAQEPDATHPA